MQARWVLKWAGGVTAASAVSTLVYSLIVEPIIVARWGATDAEVRATYLGDELVPNAKRQRTKAITIHASAEQIFPWLLQLGQGKGGFYSYEFIENQLLGCDITNANRIVPAWQHPQVGDLVRMVPPHKNAPPPYSIAQIVPNQVLVMGHRNDMQTAWFDSWQFVLVPIDAHKTRLIHRVRSVGFGNVWDLLEPAYFIMERRMVLGIKERAEALAQQQVQSQR